MNDVDVSAHVIRAPRGRFHHFHKNRQGFLVLAPWFPKIAKNRPSLREGKE